jgi:hypothetical protein
MPTLRLVGDVCAEIGKNAAMTVPALRRRRLTRARAFAPFTGETKQLDRFAFRLLRMVQENVDQLAGKTILEGGPGDFLTSGLSLLAAGATSYTSIDRFVSDYSRPEAKVWYEAVQSAWPTAFPDLPWPEWLDASQFPEAYADRVQPIAKSIEQTEHVGSFDVVCSSLVIQHVLSVTAFGQVTAAMLRPGGVGIHLVDFGPLGCWRTYEDPLMFLRFPDFLWNLMGSARGAPNRCRFHEIYDSFTNAGLSIEVRGLEYMAADGIDHVSRRFRRMPASSVCTKTAIFICRHSCPRL